MRRDALEDLGGRGRVLLGAEDVLERLAREVEGDGLALERREGDDAVEVALELADRRLDLAGEEERDVVLERDLAARRPSASGSRPSSRSPGSWMSTMRPPSKRLLSRSVRPGISRGGTSDEKTIWFPSS